MYMYELHSIFVEGYGMGAWKQYRGSILCFLILVIVLAAAALLVW